MKKLYLFVGMLIAFAMTTTAQNMTLPEGYTTCETCNTKSTTVKKDNNKSTVYVEKKETKKVVYVSGNTTYKKNTGNCNNQKYQPQGGNQGNGQTGVMIAGMIVNTGLQVMNRFLPMNGNGGYNYGGGYGMMPMNNGYNNNGYYNGMTQPFIW